MFNSLIRQFELLILKDFIIFRVEITRISEFKLLFLFLNISILLRGSKGIEDDIREIIFL